MFLNYTGTRRVVWIIGHSFVFWAKLRAASRIYGSNIGLNTDNYKVYWAGFRGMRWVDFLEKISELMCSLPAPDILVVHLGGNDLGLVKTLDLFFNIKHDFLLLKRQFPNLVIVFSEIIYRQLWSYDSSMLFLNKIRKRLNKFVAKFMPSVGGSSYRHIDLEGDSSSLFRSDNIHFNDIGLDIFNIGLQNAVELAMVVGGASRVV